MRCATPLLLLLVLLGSCTTVPSLPTVDESTRRPANTPQAIEMQQCRSNLQNERILATESMRNAAFTAAIRDREESALHVSTSVAGNDIVTLHFDTGRADVVVPESVAKVLATEAPTAPLVVVRARTDGTLDSAAESRIARQRAAAVRDYLVHIGVAPDHIRATYQPSGDAVADNTTSTGRALNRRAEIEIYRARPVPAGGSSAEHP